jgi:S1-C subfamily serine protease
MRNTAYKRTVVRFPLILILVFPAVLNSCGYYKYDGVTYQSREAARAAALRDINLTVGGIVSSTQKIGGKLLIVIPTRNVIEQHGVIKESMASEDVIGFIVDVLELGFLGIADGIRKAQLFDSVTVLRKLDTDSEPIAGYDYKMWLVGKGFEQWQWYLSKNGVNAQEIISADTVLQRTARLNSFNSVLLRAAAALGGTPVAALATPPQKEKPSFPISSGPSVSTGTAFFISSNGLAMTNAHVVSSCMKILALVTAGEPISISVAAVDRENDLALLKVGSRSETYAQFRAGIPVRQGEQIVTYGYPLAGALASRGNLSSGIVSALTGLFDDTRELQISAPVQLGNSGGPVLDASGSVIGVVTSKLDAVKTAIVIGDIPQNVNFAIKATVVMNFLDANNVRYETTTAKKEIPITDIGEKAKGFTFLIECYR